MADPATTDLTTLEQDLTALAVPTPTPTSGTSATPTTALNDVQTILKLLYGGAGLSQINTIGTDLATGLTQAATILAQLASVLQTVASTTSGVSASLASIQTALGVAQSVAPSSVSALSQGSQFLSMIQNLLTPPSGSSVPNPAAAATLLLQISQQFNAIATAVHP